MAEATTMERVVVSRPVVFIGMMQVCAVDDAWDDEILEVCNQENPSGTTDGWSLVIRRPDGSLGQEGNKAPVPCEDHPGRTHFLILC